MEKRYRIGEMAKQMGVSRHTLMHYEDCGLIVPEVDPETGYRYYSFREFGNLILVRNMREAGFSIEEIAQLRTCGLDVHEQMGWAHISQIDDEIRGLSARRDLLERRMAYLSRCRTQSGSWELREAESLTFIPQFFQGNLSNEHDDACAQAWREAYERSELAMRVTLESVIGEKSCDPVWGFVPYSCIDTDSPLTVFAQHLYSGIRLDVFIDCPAFPLDEGLAMLKKALQESGTEPVDDALFVVNAVYDEGSGIRTAMTATIPVGQPEPQ